MDNNHYQVNQYGLVTVVDCDELGEGNAYVEIEFSTTLTMADARRQSLMALYQKLFVGILDSMVNLNRDYSFDYNIWSGVARIRGIVKRRKAIMKVVPLQLVIEDMVVDVLNDIKLATGNNSPLQFDFATKVIRMIRSSVGSIKQSLGVSYGLLHEIETDDIGTIADFRRYLGTIVGRKQSFRVAVFCDQNSIDGEKLSNSLTWETFGFYPSLARDCCRPSTYSMLPSRSDITLKESVIPGVWPSYMAMKHSVDIYSDNKLAAIIVANHSMREFLKQNSKVRLWDIRFDYIRDGITVSARVYRKTEADCTYPADSLNDFVKYAGFNALVATSAIYVHEEMTHTYSHLLGGFGYLRDFMSDSTLSMLDGCIPSNSYSNMLELASIVEDVTPDDVRKLIEPFISADSKYVSPWMQYYCGPARD